MKYTNSKEADKKIEKDMKIIIEEILKIDKVISIILTGGFSRGEGPVKIEKGQIFPYNDYDIQVISNRKISKIEADNLSTEISKKIGYRGIVNFYPLKKEEQKINNNFYLDLKWDTPKDLKKLLPRIRTYELKNNSMILYGQDIRNIIPDYKLENIPLSEGAKILLDRMSQMIEYYSTENKHEREFLTYIIQQAYAAICTTLLMLCKRYQIGYQRSMKIFKEVYKDEFPELNKKIPNLDKKIEQFVKWKIDSKKKEIKNIEKEWFIAKNSLLEVAKCFFSKFLNKDIQTIEELANSILNMGKEFYTPYIKAMREEKVRGIDWFDKTIGYIFVPLLFRYNYNKRLKELSIHFKSKTVSPDLTIFSSLVYLIDSIKEGNKIDERSLDIGKRRLSSVYPTKGSNWEEISVDYANAYIAFFLQKI